MFGGKLEIIIRLVSNRRLELMGYTGLVLWLSLKFSTLNHSHLVGILHST